jgi:hypothetical protein
MMTRGEYKMYVNPNITLTNFDENDDIIIFPHVPKTAGTSMRDALQLVFGDRMLWIEGEVLLAPAVRALNRITSERRKKIKVIFGHMPFGLHEHLDRRNCYYVSLIRDPIVRVASHYAHEWRYHVFHSDVGAALAESPDIVSYFNRLGPEYHFPSRNLQSTMLLPDVPQWEGNVLSQRAVDFIQRHYWMIGTTERFSDFLIAFLKGLGISNHPSVPSHNTGLEDRTATLLSSWEAQVLENWNGCDLSLWKFVNPDNERPRHYAKNEEERLKALLDLRKMTILNCQKEFSALLKDRMEAQKVMEHLSRALEKREHEAST